MLLFDKIIVTIGRNSGKDYMFSIEKGLQWLRDSFFRLLNIEVEAYEKVTTQFCVEKYDCFEFDKAIFYGLLFGLSLISGALFGLYANIPRKKIAWIMAFGCGVLISSLSIDLMEDAFEKTQDAFILTLGFIFGAVVYVIGDYYIEKNGGEERRQTFSIDKTQTSSGKAILIGTLLDAIPESLAMGAILAEGKTGVLFATAIFISNFPEGISASIAMKNAGLSKSKIMSVLIGMVIFIILSTVTGYLISLGVTDFYKAAIITCASGAMLAMISDTMLPESYKIGGKKTALFVSIGFIVSFFITKFS